MIPWRREWLPTPIFWPGEFHGLYCLWSHKESDTTKQLALSLFAFSGNETAWGKDAHISDDPFEGQTEGYEPKATLILLQGISPTQGLNPGLPHCRWILYQLNYQEGLLMSSINK